MSNLGTYLYPVTIAVTIVAIVSANLHAIQQLGKPLNVASLCTNVSLAIVAIICVLYLWDKPMARYANMVYTCGWTAASVLTCF